jgi:hypothetical protein
MKAYRSPSILAVVTVSVSAIILTAGLLPTLYMFWLGHKLRHP